MFDELLDALKNDPEVMSAPQNREKVEATGSIVFNGQPEEELQNIEKSIVIETPTETLKDMTYEQAKAISDHNGGIAPEKREVEYSTEKFRDDGKGVYTQEEINQFEVEFITEYLKNERQKKILQDELKSLKMYYKVRCVNPPRVIRIVKQFAKDRVKTDDEKMQEDITFNNILNNETLRNDILETMNGQK